MKRRVEDLRLWPAYLTYASDDLASEKYCRMSALERGVLDAMRRAQWVSEDGSIPADIEGLAFVTRLPEEEVRLALRSTRLLSYFEEANGRLIERDLRGQRADRTAIRQKQIKAANDTNAEIAARKAAEQAKSAESVASPRLQGTVSDTVSDTVTVAVSDTESGTVLNRTEKKRLFQGGADYPEHLRATAQDSPEHKGRRR